jgi:hypothetical protein
MKDTRNTWQHPMDWVIAAMFVATLVAVVCGWI